MKTKIKTLRHWFTVVLIIILFFLVLGEARAQSVQTSVTVTAGVECNPYNCDFVVDGNRGGEGYVMGTYFYAEKVIENPDIVRFETFLSTWYVTDKGIIYADSDTQALSIYLTM